MRSRPLIALCLALLVAACSAPAERVSSERFAAHVAWLADDAREGRGTGTAGLNASAGYVAAAFERAGLTPAGDDGGWMQAFTVDGPRVLGEGNVLTIGETALELETDWLPFGSSASASVRGPFVFAGFGIHDPEHGYDDYAGLEVEGAVVLVLRRGPGHTLELLPENDPRRRYLGPQGQAHVTFASKVNEAFKRGAAAVLVVNDPIGHEPGGEQDTLLAYDGSGGSSVSASIPAAQLTAAAGSRALEALGYDLTVLQQRIDSRRTADGPFFPRSFRFPGTSAHVTVDAERQPLETFNVVGLLPGGDPALGQEHVILGAHMDHLGRGQIQGSMGGAAAVGQIHNGADDNASGTAGLLEAARVLGSRADELRRGVVFVAFSAEELGLLGSRHYAEHPARPLADAVAMINMDMIGRSVEGYLEVGGVGSSDDFGPLLDELGAAWPELDLVRAEGQVSGNSDHASFLEQDVPVLFLFTGLHEQYHKPDDDAQLVDTVYGAQIAGLAVDAVEALARSDGRPAFSTPAASGPHGAAPADAAASSGYRVRFGSSPDMAWSGQGVRIGGVGADSPAAQAGLQKGDVIVALDGVAIESLGQDALMDYSVLLFAHEPGDVITVTVERDGETLDLTATLQGQPGDR